MMDNGGKMLATCEVITTAVNMDNPEDRHWITTVAQGWDSTDKGIYKAISGGRKYGIFGMFNLQLGGKYFLDVGGSLLLKSVAVNKFPMGMNPNTGGKTKVLTFMNASSGEAYDYAKGKWGMVELLDKADALKDDLTQMNQQKIITRKEVESKAIEATDIVIGVIEGSGLSDLSTKGSKAASWLKKSQGLAVGVSKANVPLEVLKVTYENAKFMHKLHKQFTAVANAQQGTQLAPVFVTIKDSDGYEIIATRRVTVRTWEKEE